MDKKQPSPNRNYKRNSGGKNKSSSDNKPSQEKNRSARKKFDKKFNDDSTSKERKLVKKREHKTGEENKRTYNSKEKPFEKKSFDRKRKFDNKETEEYKVKRKSYSKDGDDNAKKYRKKDDKKHSNDYSRKKSYSSEDKEHDTPKKYRKSESIKSYDDKPKKKYYSEDDNNEGQRKYKKFDKKNYAEKSEKNNYQDNEKEYNKRKRTEKTLKLTKKDDDSEGIRLNKYIANAGICSRREADEMIQSGVISVNGEIVTQLGIKIKPGDIVKYDNRVLKNEKKVYVLLNKPKDYLTTTKDPQNRKTVMDLVRNACKENIYPVGRLDRATTGLLLFTNDGEIAEKLMHPKNRIRKVYHVSLDRALTRNDMEAIAKGIELEDGIAEVDVITYVGDESDKKEIGMELHSGKNRIVRRIFEHLGYKVLKLDRVVFAGLTKKDLPRGRWRFLTEQEVNLLHRI